MPEGSAKHAAEGTSAARRQGQVAKQAKAEKACQDAYTKSVNAIEAQISALDVNAPDYDAQRSALEAQETAAGTTQQACMKKAQSS